jgi:eukaryotic-like serine/threonine-protein kinase
MMPASLQAWAMQPVVSSAQIVKFGLFEADAARNTLTRNGVRVKIQDQPFRVLLVLLERPGEIVTRQELRRRLWPEGTYVDFDGSLNVILKKLRAAIDDGSDNPRFIETVPRRGYRFIAPVTVRGTKAEALVPSNVMALESPASTPTLGPPPRVPDRHRPPHPIYMVSAAALVLVIGTAWFTWRGNQFIAKTSDRSLPPIAQVPARKSIAVLGFHNVSGKVDYAWLATAFSEMLSTELSGGEKLRLVSGEDVANLRLSSPWAQTDTLDQNTAARIGNALNSDLLVLGSYTTIGRRDRGQVRLDVRLQDAKTGEILTEIAEIGSSEDLFHIVSRIGGKLRDRLGVPRLEDPDEESVLASLPLNREGARFYALGIAKLREFDALAARDLLEQAVNADPKFSLAHAMLARAWSQLGYEQKRKEEAKKGLDLSADLPRVERLLVEGDYYESLSDHEKAASTYRALFELFPDSVEYGLLLASSQSLAGHASQALEVIARLRRLPAPASDDPRIDLLEARTIPNNKPASLVLVRSALRKATAQGKKLVYAQARRDECFTLTRGDHPEQAPASCQEAYEIFLSAGNRLGAADTIGLMGDYEGSQGHMEKAIATYQRALKILQELGEHAETGAVLNDMAINFANEGKLDRAEQLYRQAKFHFEQAGDRHYTAVAIGNIADILYLRGNLPAAEKLYQQDLDIEASRERGEPGYAMYRLADLELTQGRVQDAHRLAQQAIDAIRPSQGDYQYLVEAMIELGEVLKAEGDLEGARQQFQATLDIEKKDGVMGMVQESQAELADLALDEGHPGQAEPILRSAIAAFEQEKSDPASAAAYIDLSRALLMQGKLEEARKAVQRGTEFSQTSSDPALKLPAAIQNARVETAIASQAGANPPLGPARLQLRSTAAVAKKLGYYGLECEARLALGEAEMKTNPSSARAQLASLATETHVRGLNLLARDAEQAAAPTGTAVAANKTAE